MSLSRPLVVDERSTQAATGSCSSDAAAIERCQNGDVEAFSAVVDRHRNAVYSFAYRMTGDREAAQDLAQEAFVRGFRALNRYDRNRPFLPWIMTIAANLSRSWLRRPAARNESLEAVEGDTVDAPRLRLIDENEQRRREVRQAVVSLPAHFRVVIVLRHLRGLSYEEMSEVLHLPVSTIEHRLRTAREKLKEILVG